jgi:dolichol-phosphate mannosyltransferase
MPHPRLVRLTNAWSLNEGAEGGRLRERRSRVVARPQEHLPFLSGLLLPCLLAGVLTWVLVATGAELALQRSLYRAYEGWIWADSPFVRVLYQWGPKPALLAGVAALAFLLASTFRRAWRGHWRAALFLPLVLLLGPGLFVSWGFKAHWGRPRPRDVVEFGGTLDYRAPWQAVTPQNDNGSFPSGHASMGFVLGAPAIPCRRRRPVLAALFLAAGLISGFAVGAARIVQGGHFLNDVLWAGVMVYVAAAAAHRLLFPGLVPAGAVTEGADSRSPSPPGDGSHVPAHLWTGATGRTLSVVIPFFNEQDNVVPVLEEIRSACPHAEIIAVDDGSTDATRARILAVPHVILVSHASNLGQSAALYSGLTRATGDFCVMIDGDGQNDPRDITALVRALDSADAACGYRATRRDTWQRRAASRIANRIRHAVLRDGIRDTGCMLKAIRRDHVRFLLPFNGMHRFMPALLRNAGLSLVEVPVNHRPRLRGDSKYTISGRARRGLFDLIGVAWLLSRQLRFPREITVISPER